MWYRAQCVWLWLICVWPALVLALQGPPQDAADPAGQAGQPSLELPGNLTDLLPPADQESDQPVRFQARYWLQTGKRTGVVELQATIAPGWHLYSVTQPDGGPSRSEIRVLSEHAKLLGPFRPDHPPEVRFDDVFQMEVEEHSDQVTWSAPIELAEGHDPEKTTIELRFDGQVCQVACIPLRNVRVQAQFAGYQDELPQLLAPKPSLSGTVPGARMGPGAPGSQALPPTDSSVAGWSVSAVLVYLGFGLLGGFLLNFMPCVLPVVGLKILAFAQQAHEDRRRVFLLNVWFSLGIMAVFLLLATLAAVFNMSWGQQFTHTWFKVAMIVLVFAMALSFLGVWELAVPSFLGRGRANELQEKEGFLGAFFKGVFTTLLSTPCSGPALGAVFAFVLGKPALLTYLLFGSIGLGMALPYLVIGANPSWLRILPKPGMWMETFKQLMGFVLLGTVVFLFTTINSAYFIATFTLLVGVWFGCWWIGRIPLTASAMVYLRGWLFALAASGAVGLFAFSWLVPAEAGDPQPAAHSRSAHSLPWKPFSRQALREAIDSGKTVLVDFTAQWCLTCKYNLLTAINTAEVKALVERNGVVPLLADWTDANEEIEESLRELNSNSIPLLAIYPAGKPEQVIVLRDVITKRQLLEALERAGPSLSVPPRRDTSPALTSTQRQQPGK
ncbi:MAG: hypothetical protein KatS3mg110_2059 [Pirellulaceae bacterium]|nr:MAG: hypothetical protein KatS3mg110_2059 [Pirellulaceae bacterium]